jgi:hypothetical protein
MTDNFPKHISPEDGKDFLNKLLSIALAETLGNGYGIVIDLKGDLEKILPGSEFKKVVVYCLDGHIAVEDCKFEVLHGQVVKIQPSKENNN